MASAERYFELYRRSSIGMALVESLDDLIKQGHLTPQLALKVLMNFDKAASTVLSSQLRNKATIKGHLATYRLCDEVWTFVVKNATFKLDNAEVIGPLPRVKIVACKGSAPAEGTK